MSSLDNLRTRLTYQGGIAQEDRMDQDKLRSLKKALLYSYQAQTAILEDGREFKCLINHDKLKEDYDDKIISIPYEDVCLNGGDEKFIDWDPEDLRKINMKVGDTLLEKKLILIGLLFKRYWKKMLISEGLLEKLKMKLL